MFSTFNYTEEAFLLSSLSEVVKVWARGSGQASFNLKISDGKAELQLGFQLGHPAEPHCDPVPLPPPPQEPCQEQHHCDQPWQVPRHRRRRHKGPAQHARDRERAAMHQNQPQPQPGYPVVLPFSGKLLPLINVVSSQNEHAAVKSPAAATLSAVTPSAAEPTTPSKPTKHPEVSEYIDTNVVKKQLFAAPPPKPQHVAPSVIPAKKKKYKMKEEDLWTKLFN